MLTESLLRAAIFEIALRSDFVSLANAPPELALQILRCSEYALVARLIGASLRELDGPARVWHFLLETTAHAGTSADTLAHWAPRFFGWARLLVARERASLPPGSGKTSPFVDPVHYSTRDMTLVWAQSIDTFRDVVAALLDIGDAAYLTHRFCMFCFPVEATNETGSTELGLSLYRLGRHIMLHPEIDALLPTRCQGAMVMSLLGQRHADPTVAEAVDEMAVAWELDRIYANAMHTKAWWARKDLMGPSGTADGSALTMFNVIAGFRAMHARFSDGAPGAAHAVVQPAQPVVLTHLAVAADAPEPEADAAPPPQPVAVIEPLELAADAEPAAPHPVAEPQGAPPPHHVQRDLAQLVGNVCTQQ